MSNKVQKYLFDHSHVYLFKKLLAHFSAIDTEAGLAQQKRNTNALKKKYN